MLHYSMTLEIQFNVKMNLMQMVLNTIHPNYICHSTNIKIKHGMPDITGARIPCSIKLGYELQTCKYYIIKES